MRPGVGIGLRLCGIFPDDPRADPPGGESGADVYHIVYRTVSECTSNEQKDDYVSHNAQVCQVPVGVGRPGGSGMPVPGRQRVNVIESLSGYGQEAGFLLRTKSVCRTARTGTWW